jgi:hypothetical protein
LEQEIRRYHDPHLGLHASQAESRLRALIEEIEGDVYAAHAQAIAELQAEWHSLRARTEPLYRRVAADLQDNRPAEVAPVESDLIADEDREPLFDDPVTGVPQPQPFAPVVGFESDEIGNELPLLDQAMLFVGAPTFVISDAKLTTQSPSYFPRVHRNAPCPCRSGQKYRLCHGKRR